VNDLLDPPPDDGPGGPTRAAEHLTAHSPASVPEVEDVDVAAFVVFYRTHISGLVRFLVWMGARLSDAADLAQDTMIEAFNQWQIIEHPRAWARRVASRKYLRHLASTEEPVDQVDGRPLLPACHDLTDWEQHREIRRLLALLPSRQRQVMAWTYDGYKPHEIATELGIAAEAVRSSLKLARRKLAEQLPPEDAPR
jgi:RNA polymerase sigma factor (sigma-70 family)